MLVLGVKLTRSPLWRLYTACATILLLLPSNLESQAPTPETIDSAGIRIVLNDKPYWFPSQVWHISNAPHLQLGAANAEGVRDAEDIFFRLIGALRLPSGRIVVGNAGAHELRFYSLDGARVGVTGRKGGGPGEFEGLHWMGECGVDSVFAYDFITRRVSVFDSEGVLARSFLPTSPGSPAPPAVLACQRDGTMVIVGRDQSTTIQPMTHYRPYVPIAVATSTGRLTKLLGLFPGSERYRRARSVGPRPLGKTTAVCIGGGRVYIGFGDTYEVNAYDAVGGQRVMIVRRGVTPRRITATDRTLYQELELAKARRPSQRASWAKQFRALEYPDVFPAYASCLVDADGNLWVEAYSFPPGARHLWSVFDREGAYLGDVQIPARFAVSQIGSNWILGLWRDTLGVEYVRLYGLLK